MMTATAVKSPTLSERVKNTVAVIVTRNVMTPAMIQVRFFIIGDHTAPLRNAERQHLLQKNIFVL